MEVENLLFPIATIIAIIIGPIAAVTITRWGDDKSRVRQNQEEILKSLLRTRVTRLTYEHVGALNLIEITFHGKREILQAHKVYIDYLWEPFPPVEQQDSRHYEKGNSLLLDLIASISTELGYQFDKKDIERLAYMPRAWNENEFVERENARLIFELLKGKQALNVRLQVPDETDQFPSRPQ